MLFSNYFEDFLSYSIDGNLYSLLENFLAERLQCTRVDNSCCTKISLCSGVIQGSCLGPLLFVLYLNDIVQLFDGLCVIVYVNYMQITGSFTQ